MKKSIIFAILMVVFIISAQAQRRYGSFSMGGMNPIELSKQIDKQVSDLQKDLKNLDKDLRLWNLRSQRGGDIIADSMLNETLSRRGFLQDQIQKLIEQKNEILVSNTPAYNIRANTKNPVDMATAYYMVKVADNFSSATSVQSSNQVFTGILVNYWNYRVQVVVTGPGGFSQEFSLDPGNSRNPGVQEFQFLIPGMYTATFRASTSSAKSVTKPGGMPTSTYNHNGRQYSFKATQFGRF